MASIFGNIDATFGQSQSPYGSQQQQYLATAITAAYPTYSLNVSNVGLMPDYPVVCACGAREGEYHKSTCGPNQRWLDARVNEMRVKL